MAFFVVARTSDGSLQLVSSATFPSRQAAMSALSEATREPDFLHWDAELLVVDLDSAVPVLLVRPSQAEASVPPAAEPVLEPEALLVVEETAVDTAPEVVDELVVDVGVVEFAEEIELAEGESVPEDVVVNEVTLEPYPIEDVAIGEAIAEEILAELEAESIQPEVAETSETVAVELPETEEAAAVEDETVEEVPSFTVSALMAESAIADAVLETEAPADAREIDEVFGDLVMSDASEEPEPAVSIDERLGLAEPEPAVETPAWTLEPGPVPHDEPTADVFEETTADAVAEPAIVPPEPGAWQPDVPEAAAELPAFEPGETAEGGVVIAWPWDTQAGDESDVLAEDLVGDIELVNPPAEPIDDAVEDDPALDSLLVEPEVPVAEAPDVVDVVEAFEETGEPAAPAENVVVDADAPVGNSRDEIADFIFDLENVTDIPEAAARETGATAADEPGPTCSECVYDETCPNRDQRSPRECGSFQWKIA